MGVAVNENDPRVKRTRELLLSAFRELAEEKEMYAISVQDITERATVNRATFYAHFQDKDALMDSCFREMIQDALTAKLTTASPLTPENLRLLFRTLREFLDTKVRRCPRTGGQPHPMVQSALREELYTFLLAWLARELPERSSCRRHTPQALAMMLSWSLLGAAMESDRSRSKPTQEAAQQLVEMLAEQVGAATAADASHK